MNFILVYCITRSAASAVFRRMLLCKDVVRLIAREAAALKFDACKAIRLTCSWLQRDCVVRKVWKEYDCEQVITQRRMDQSKGALVITGEHNKRYALKENVQGTICFIDCQHLIFDGNDKRLTSLNCDYGFVQGDLFNGARAGGAFTLQNCTDFTIKSLTVVRYVAPVEPVEPPAPRAIRRVGTQTEKEILPKHAKRLRPRFAAPKLRKNPRACPNKYKKNYR